VGTNEFCGGVDIGGTKISRKDQPKLMVAACAGMFGFAAIYPTVLAVVGSPFPRFSGTAFGFVIAVGLVGGMLSPWIVGRIAEFSGLRQGLTVPVVNCVMIIALQLCIMQVMRQRFTETSRI